MDLRGLGSVAATERLEAIREEMSHAVHGTDVWPLFEVRASLLDHVNNSGNNRGMIAYCLGDTATLAHCRSVWQVAHIPSSREAAASSCSALASHTRFTSPRIAERSKSQRARSRT